MSTLAQKILQAKHTYDRLEVNLYNTETQYSSYRVKQMTRTQKIEDKGRDAVGALEDKKEK